MSIVKEYFYNIKCDCCGSLANEEMWNNTDAREEIDPERFFYHLGGKDYCPECYDYEGEDEEWIVTKDGRRFDSDTEEEKTHPCPPVEGGGKVTETSEENNNNE